MKRNLDQFRGSRVLGYVPHSPAGMGIPFGMGIYYSPLAMGGGVLLKRIKEALRNEASSARARAHILSISLFIRIRHEEMESPGAARCGVSMPMPHRSPIMRDLATLVSLAGLHLGVC